LRTTGIGFGTGDEPGDFLVASGKAAATSTILSHTDIDHLVRMRPNCLKGTCPDFGTKIILWVGTPRYEPISEFPQFVAPTFSSHSSLSNISIYGRYNIMKVFVQTKNESVVINDEIIVTVLEVKDGEVFLAVDVPEWIEVCEKETFARSESMLVRPR
jgi:carbon storage regulator CsrA